MNADIDARGLSCPQPVLMVLEAVKNGAHKLNVLVDNEASVENVLRAADNRGFSVEIVKESDTTYRLLLEKKS